MYELTDDQYSVADAIEIILNAHSAKTWTPSMIARKARVDTETARTVLVWMAAHRYAIAQGRGAWARYIARG